LARIQESYGTVSALSEADLTDIWNKREDQYRHLPDHYMTAGPDGFKGWMLDQIEGFTTDDILNIYPGREDDRALMKEAGMATPLGLHNYLNPNLLLSGVADLIEKLAWGDKTTAGDYGWAGLDVAGVTGVKPLWKLLDKTVIDPLSNTMKAGKANRLDKAIREFDPGFQANHLLEVNKTLDPKKRFNFGQFSLQQINDKRFKQSELKNLNLLGREEWGNLFGKDKTLYNQNIKKAAEDGTLHMIPWYSGPYSKMAHVVDMIHTGWKYRGEAKHMLDSVDAFFTPNVLKELEKIGLSHARAESGVLLARSPTEKITRAERNRQANIFNDQIGHILATLEMYYPHHSKTKQMRDAYGKYLFPEYSNGGKLMNTADVSVETVKDVLGPHIQGALADPKSIQSHLIDSGWFTNFKNDKLYLGSSKAFSDTGPIFSKLNNLSNIRNKNGVIKSKGWQSDGLNSWKGKLPIVQDVFNVLENWHLNPNRPELTKEYIWKQLDLKNKEYEKLYKANLEDWKDSGSVLNPKHLMKKPKLRVYDKEDVMKNLQIDNGLVSVGQEILTGDILLATIRARGVWNINDPKNGAIVLGDSYQQGAGAVDKVVGIGSDVNRFFYDVIPWNSKTGSKYHFETLPPNERMVSSHLWDAESLKEMGLSGNEVRALKRGLDSSVILSLAQKTGKEYELAQGPMEKVLGKSFGPPLGDGDLLDHRFSGKDFLSGIKKREDYWNY
jgi:hypothetical protein